MKFKKEDMGLYMALILVGGGVGLLIASLISSRSGLLEVLEEELEELEEENERIRKATDEIEEARQLQLEEAEKSYAAFVEEYQPTPIQLQMLKNDLITEEELKKVLSEGLPVDEFKPKLSDLVTLPEDGMSLSDIKERKHEISDRYIISEEPPEDKDPKRMRVLYCDLEDESVYTMTRTKEPVATDPRDIVDYNTWIVLQQNLFSGRYPVLYVDDTQTVKYYRFEVVSADPEESVNSDAEHR